MKYEGENFCVSCLTKPISTEFVGKSGNQETKRGMGNSIISRYRNRYGEIERVRQKDRGRVVSETEREREEGMGEK